MSKHISIIIILVAAGWLLFANLGNQYLWQDEAETAVLAENTLEYGFPKAFDGKNIVNPRIGEHSHVGFGKDYTWLYHPWVQFYITAFSFLVFGASTFTARLPFAFIGLLNILLVYILSLELTKRRFIAGCAAFLMTFSVPYLLFMRQCRYYAPAVFFVLFILLFYSRFKERGQWRDAILMTIGLIGLGYTVHGIFIPIFGAIILHYFFFVFNRKTLLPFILACIVAAGAVAPWFLSSESLGHTAKMTIEKFGDNLEFQIRMINKYMFPMVFFGIVYALRLLWRKTFRITLSHEEKRSLSLILMVIVVSILAFCFVEQRHLRYLVYFIPLLAVLEGMILLRLARFNKILLGAFLAISITTGVFNMGYPNPLFPKYVYEITHDYDGPIEGIVKFLNENAKEGDTVKIIYGDQPLIFYTDLKIDNSWMYDDEHMPEWIVFRRGWHEKLDNNYYTKVQTEYKKHVLDYPDIRYENRPGDLGYHKFATDREAPGVIIFERAGK